ncbi:MAG TPA: hypothetical protein GX697_04310 [Firmicutes bacterium]|nr:hypothetical protein [Bacillota bacterium]
MDRYLRHELVNQLQILYSLSQLGKYDRLERAILSLCDKLKVIGLLSRVAGPELLNFLENLIFALPADAGVNLDMNNSFSFSELNFKPAKLISSFKDLFQRVSPSCLNIRLAGGPDAPELFLSFHYRLPSNREEDLAQNIYKEMLSADSQLDLKVEKQEDSRIIIIKRPLKCFS